MNPHKRFYFYGAALLVFGAYNFYQNDVLECVLYTMAGITFVMNALPHEASLLQYKKLLVIVSWVLIFITAILFLYMLQFKFLQA